MIKLTPVDSPPYEQYCFFFVQHPRQFSCVVFVLLLMPWTSQEKEILQLTDWWSLSDVDIAFVNFQWWEFRWLEKSRKGNSQNDFRLLRLATRSEVFFGQDIRSVIDKTFKWITMRLFYNVALSQSTGWLSIKEETFFPFSRGDQVYETQEIATLQRPVPDRYVPLITRFILSQMSVSILGRRKRKGDDPIGCPSSTNRYLLSYTAW